MFTASSILIKSSLVNRANGTAQVFPAYVIVNNEVNAKGSIFSIIGTIFYTDLS